MGLLGKRSTYSLLLFFLGVLAPGARLQAQGCMPATPQPLPLALGFEPAGEYSLIQEEDGARLGVGGSNDPTGTVGSSGDALAVPRTARDLQLLESKSWSFAAALRYFKSGDSYVGSEQVGKNFAVGEYPSLNLSGTYAFDPRWSLSVALPLVNPRDTFPHPDGERHTTGPGLSIGDLRAVGSYWAFDPTRPRRGNVVFGFGIKAPTGNYDVTDAWHTPDGPIEEPADLAVQPGDGGWGIIFATQAFRALAHGAYAYIDGFYLVNPRETNGTVTATVKALVGEPIPLSVPDYYQARAGFGYMAWPKQGISLSLGMRIDGIPTEDLIGGSEGFRRPGYTLALEPGISVNWGDHTISLFTPVAIQRSQKQSLPEERLGLNLGGSMSAEAFLFSYSRRLGKPAGAKSD